MFPGSDAVAKAEFCIRFAKSGLPLLGQHNVILVSWSMWLVYARYQSQ